MIIDAHVHFDGIPLAQNARRPEKYGSRSIQHLVIGRDHVSHGGFKQPRRFGLN